MSIGQHLPLGQRIPASLHAVSVSIPTMADVVGYEEKNPATMAKLATGYPRFVVHTCLRAIETHWQRLFAKPGQPIWLACSEAMAKRLQTFLAPAETKFLRHRGVCGLRLPPDPETNLLAKRFLQHVGGYLSTRQAEDYLLAEGLLDAPYPEKSHPGDAAALVRESLAPLLGVRPAEIALATSGMNAFYAAFEAVNQLQAPKARFSWIKLGWLYADTMHILDKLSPAGARNEELLDVFDLDRLETLLANRGHEIAGIVTEAPTNPLIQTPDLERIHALARRHGAFFVVDPTVNSPANLDVSRLCDVLVTSLTKYAAHEGDVILGAATVNPNCPARDTLLAALHRHAEPPYPRDLARLAAQVGSSQQALDTINANTRRVVEYLQHHPKIAKVHWALEPRSAANYARYARSPNAVGGLVSFEYKGPLAELHDRVAIDKGPSFGMATSLLCPFIYLAHYDLVTSQAGRKRLALAGISPDLLRFSIGAEPAEDIIAALAAALD